MNKVEYNQTEGFPLDVNILDFGQKANQISQELGHIIAPLAIVSGCTENSNNISDGVVFIEGELLPFKGGLKQDNIRVVEEIEKREFENGVQKDVLITRFATFGIGAVKTYKWSDFHRSITIKEIEKRLVHVGFIQDYYGDINKIPAGWYLCDGQNGTPDLRGLFVVGYDSRNTEYNQVGKTGGEKDVTLTVNQMPKHIPSGSVYVPPHSHTFGWQMYHENGSIENHSASGGSGIQNERKFNGVTESSGGGTFNLNIQEIGGDQAHENRPPFYVLAKIMYKG
jgi:microcystin-dependent protein